MTPRATRAPIVLWTVFGVFTVLLILLVARSVAPRDAAEYAPSALAPADVPDTLFVDTLTIDARDPNRWAFVDLERSSAVLPPDTTGWDLAFRRFEIVTSGPAAASSTPFDDVARAPDSAFVQTTFARDTTNSALEDWYRYSFTSHLLTPRSRTYIIRTSAGRYAKIQFLGYYCPQMTAGCPTFRYAYQPDGTPNLRVAP